MSCRVNALKLWVAMRARAEPICADSVKTTDAAADAAADVAVGVAVGVVDADDALATAAARDNLWIVALKTEQARLGARASEI